MNAFFWKKVGLDFGRTFLGFWAAAVSAAFVQAIANVEAADFTVASWKTLAVGLGISAASAALRAAQAYWTKLETPPAA